jgi:hypothetical protein
MPRSSTGKWVSRAGATGGGRTYRGQIPVNWYAGLILIVIIGLVSVIYSRYEYQHPAASNVSPTVGQTLFAGLAIDVCGNLQKALAPSTNTAVAGITTPGDNVLNVSPHVKGQAGDNATLGQFFDNYKGLKLTSDSITVPKKKTYKNGQICGSGSKDAGQHGVIKYEVWPNAVSNSGTLTTGDPSSLKIGSRTLITVGFVPASVTKLPKPPSSTVNALLVLAGSVSNGTTTTTTTTTTPSSTTTTAPGATIGSSTTTTTAPTGTTTTTK